MFKALHYKKSNFYVLLFLTKWCRNKFQHVTHSVWIDGYFATCVIFFWGTDFVVGSATGGKTIQHFIMATCSLISEEPTSHYNTEINPKPLTFHFSTWYHHDTYVFGHMTLGVEHTAWNYQSPIISSQSKTDTSREQSSLSASLLFSQKRTFLLPITTVAPKTQFPTVPTPNITDNYDPINITAFFNKILRLPSAMPSSRYSQTA